MQWQLVAVPFTERVTHHEPTGGYERHTGRRSVIAGRDSKTHIGGKLVRPVLPGVPGYAFIHPARYTDTERAGETRGGQCVAGAAIGGNGYGNRERGAVRSRKVVIDIHQLRAWSLRRAHIGNSRPHGRHSD